MIVDKCNNNTKAKKDCKSENEIQTFLTSLIVRVN